MGLEVQIIIIQYSNTRDHETVPVFSWLPALVGLTIAKKRLIETTYTYAHCSLQGRIQ